MREILFRGKTKAKHIYDAYWLYGDLVHLVYNEGLVFMFNELQILDEVDPETVGQFTGLYDKNGKRIFEGDIVRFDYVNDDGNDAAEDFLIFYTKGAFCAQYLGNIKCPSNILHIKQRYVIGNKWDNPELLGVKK